jgi:hypothetical protein
MKRSFSTVISYQQLAIISWLSVDLGKDGKDGKVAWTGKRARWSVGESARTKIADSLTSV